ncbi:MAG: hypothetical protein IPQ09_02795 [Myxococcales bacterium]|nr:hypothetical protein [Myxococcales bacterium]HQY60980.1 hypothetical protein [Polyangiaceae bacterium]
MPASDAWNVLPHGPLEALAPNLWRVEGELPDMPLKRVMTVARRDDGSLLVHNAMALDETTMRALDARGQVTAVIVPNGFHRMDAPAYAARYPEAKFFAPNGSLGKVQLVVPRAASSEALVADASTGYEVLDGCGGQEGVLTVRSGDEVTLVLNDVVFNMPHVPGVKGFVLRHVTASSGGPRVSRVGRLFLVKDKRALGAHLERLAATPGLRRVIVSHHEVLAADPAASLRAVAASL